MALAKDYASVMGRSNDIQKDALGLDYAKFETSPISFDYEKLMTSTGYTLEEVNRIQSRFGVGDTPLLELRNITRLARKYAKPGYGARIFAKDEAANASGSFKDRRAACAVYHAKKLGYKGVMAATSGNYGAAVASQAAMQGLKCIIVQECYDSKGIGQPEIVEKARKGEAIKPEMEWCGDGVVMMTMCIPTHARAAEAVALEIGHKLGLDEPVVISKEVLQNAEGTRVEMKGKVPFDIDPSTLEIPAPPHHQSDEVLYKEFEEHPMVIVCGTVGNDEHSVGLREIINIKHGGIEKWGIKVNYLGTSVPVEKLVDAAVELDTNAILASTIISHDNVHYKNMKRINELAIEKGIRDKVIVAAGGTQVIPDEARETGIDEGFGRDSHGIDVATFLAEEAMRRRGEEPPEVVAE